MSDDKTCATCRHNFADSDEYAACGLAAERGEWITAYPHETCDEHKGESDD